MGSIELTNSKTGKKYNKNFSDTKAGALAGVVFGFAICGACEFAGNVGKIVRVKKYRARIRKQIGKNKTVRYYEDDNDYVRVTSQSDGTFYVRLNGHVMENVNFKTLCEIVKKYTYFKVEN